MEWSLGVRIHGRFQDDVRESDLRRAAEVTLEAEGVDDSVELGFFVTDDATVRKLNRQYRGIDRVTDVLAFGFQADEVDEPFPSLPDGIRHLGEVILSCPQAARQAKEANHSLIRELSILTIHGVLHLLGYDHEQPEEGQQMRDRETRILSALGEVKPDHPIR